MFILRRMAVVAHATPGAQHEQKEHEGKEGEGTVSFFRGGSLSLKQSADLSKNHKTLIVGLKSNNELADSA